MITKIDDTIVVELASGKVAIATGYFTDKKGVFVALIDKNKLPTEIHLNPNKIKGVDTSDISPEIILEFYNKSELVQMIQVMELAKKRFK
jgi:hypothetical protein